ncbi:MAG: hypothetical protein WCH62_02640 [Candidatus Omnitrophota bacterium]
MKKLLVLVAVSTGLILSSSVWAQNSAVKATDPAVAPTATAAAVGVLKADKGEMHKTVKHVRHPEVRTALRKLHMAKENLEMASHEYAGHRAKAVEAIKLAIKELEEALKSSDKK